MGETGYVQSNFDKAFVKTIEHLHKIRYKHGKFRTRKELLNKLGGMHSNYSHIKNGKRGVPLEKQNIIKKILKEEFHINPNFLDSDKGEMFSNDAVTHDRDDMNKEVVIDGLKKEVEFRKNFINAQERIIDNQKETIEFLKGRIQSLEEILSKAIDHKRPQSLKSNSFQDSPEKQH